MDANLAAAGFAAADFDAVVAADDFEAIKPAPDIFLAAARMMGVAAADCVVVEDAPAGIQAAKAAGKHLIMLHKNLCFSQRHQKHVDHEHDMYTHPLQAAQADLQFLNPNARL